MKAISIELPAGRRTVQGGRCAHYSTMTNAYYRWHNATPFTPYIGGGVGESTVV